MMVVRIAFDSVNTKQLLKSLERSGIRGIALNLIRTYLTNRKQIVKICDFLSTTRNVLSGVVQGDILGSLLFLIFFNETTKLP